MDITHTTSHPDPQTLYPIEGISRTVFLKNIIKNPKIQVGDYTYYDDPEDVHNFEKNVLYLFDFLEDRLIIGKFCQIASGVKFIMNGANHPLGGVSTYPFKVFGKAWAEAELSPASKGDTVVGNDVWLGHSAVILPGVHIGDGAIVGAQSVVTQNVEPYSIVGGNPARLIRKRFDEETIAFLLDLGWWDWPVEKITEHLSLLLQGDIKGLRTIGT
jgi:virginiamycin A acetyltransferase